MECGYIRNVVFILFSSEMFVFESSVFLPYVLRLTLRKLCRTLHYSVFVLAITNETRFPSFSFMISPRSFINLESSSMQTLENIILLSHGIPNEYIDWALTPPFSYE